MNIGVIFGGESCEHDISIITGVQLMNNINEYLYNIIPIYIDKVGNWFTGKNLKDIDNYPNGLGRLEKCSLMPNDKNLYIEKSFSKMYKKKIALDMVFVCMHGLRGEDGTLAAILEMSKIPYSSSSIAGSSVCMDKAIFKNFARGLGINVIDGVEITKNDFYTSKEIVFGKVGELSYPVIIKPSRQGSSIGISVCEGEDLLEAQLKTAFNYDNSVLIEKFLNIDKEVNVAVFDNKGDYILSNTEEPITSDQFLNFDNKYRQNPGGFETIKRKVPASVTDEQYDVIVRTAFKVYSALKMFGVVRFDFIVSKGEVYLNEVNTIPGSMAYYLFDKQKYPYSKLIEMWISNAVFRFSKDNEIVKTLDTDILDNGFNGFKK